ncbi:MAG: site-specific integrase [Acidimicrobiia bacterium]|nr:site-specific integrase [Acidimicrobiia bacterium]
MPVPARPEGVYPDGRGRWYFKATAGRDPRTRKRVQVTRRGYRTASDAGKARREFLERVASTGGWRATRGISVDDLLDLYLDGIDVDRRLSAKTRYDYRKYADAYVRPYLGHYRVTGVTSDLVIEWQRRLATSGGAKNAKPLSPNTIRLARAPLAGAFKEAAARGLVSYNPLVSAPRPVRPRSVPRHWSPEQAREFLSLMEHDRTYPVWAFLLGSGVRIGELVWLQWKNVDGSRGRVHIVEFAATLGYALVPSVGKSREAVRSIELDTGLLAILRMQRALQSEERLVAANYDESDYVFTKPSGGAYHPQYLSRLLGRHTSELGLPRVTAHGLRHTSATLMLASGVPPKVAAERLGHADPTLFMNLYSHATPTMHREAAAKIGEMLFGHE